MGNPNNHSIDINKIKEDVKNREREHYNRLNAAMMASFTSLEGLQDWIVSEMKRIDMIVDEFVVDLCELGDQPCNQKTILEKPDSLVKAKNVVGKMPGKGPRHGMLLFGHADKRPETFVWAKERPEIINRDGRLYSPGISDDVSGITAMLSAAETFKRLGMEPQGDLLVASILGKQMGIFGTYGLMKRFGPLDAAVYSHPAESGDGLGVLKIASLGNLEFIIEVIGKPPDTSEGNQVIFSSSAVNAIDKAGYLINGLQRWAVNEAVSYRCEKLEESAGKSLALSVGWLQAGDESLPSRIPLSAKFGGVIAFPPTARLKAIRNSFLAAFEALVLTDPWLAQNLPSLKWGDLIDDSCQADENCQFIRHAVQAIEDTTGKTPRFYYGHSMSDIRYPMLYWNAQSFGVGPLAGGIGTPDEWLDWNDYLNMIVVITEILKLTA